MQIEITTLGAAITCALVMLIWLLRWLARPYPMQPRIPRSDTDFRNVDVQKLLAPRTGKRYAVTGGSGMLGNAIVEHLLLRGEKHIRVLDVVEPRPEVRSQVEFVRCDIGQADQVQAALRGVDVVLHSAAILSFHHHWKFQLPLSQRVNVHGTQNVVDACLANDVQVLVNVASSNVVVDLRAPRPDIPEEEPYVSQPVNHYSPTKAAAERLVLAAHGQRTAGGAALRTVSVRPGSALFGVGDFGVENYLKDRRLVPLASVEGQLDYTYCENISHGVLLAEQKLWAQAAGVGGHAFNLTNQQPMRAIDFYKAVQHFAPEVRILQPPVALLWLAAGVIDVLLWVTRGRLARRLGAAAILTLATMRVANLQYTMDDSRAVRLLGYRPLYSVDEGVQKTVARIRARAARAKPKSA